MKDIHAISFAISKTKLLTTTTATLPMLFGAIKIINTAPEKFDTMFPGARYVLMPIAFLGIAFSILILFFVYKKLSDTQPGFTVSDEGITDNSSAVSAGFIPWSDVLEINEKTIFGQHYLRVKVNNPESYINRQTNGLKRFMMRRNHKSFDAAISISASSMRCSFEELKDLLNRRFAAYKAEFVG